MVLRVLHPGDVFGDIPFLCHMAPPFGARALTVELDVTTFWALLETRPEICRRMLMGIVGHLWNRAKAVAFALPSCATVPGSRSPNLSAL